MKKAIKNKGGQPTKYNDKYILEVDVYLKKNNSSTRSLPTKEGFALSIGVHDDTLDNWANQKYPEDYEDEKLKGKLVHPKFFGALRKILLIQKIQLMNDGIYNKDVNATIVKLMLQNNHGMREKTDQTTDGKAIVGFNYIEPKTETNA